METARWRDVRRLFDAACDLPSSEWERRLRTLSHDPALIGEVLALLQAQTVGFDRAMRPLGEMMASLSTDELKVGDRLGVWELTERLASGGMGSVFVAERADGLFRQRVAIKLLRGSARTAAAAQRMATERQILAELQHPNIARLYDGGTTPAGQPYLVMEYVDGLPLDAHCALQVLDLHGRLRMFLRVCAAVQAAHARLIIHCDLKPSNVLVRANGEPVLLDFGIARLLDAGEGEGTGDFCTPAYASPEQLRGAHVGVASDVFSLGVLLTELVAGTRSGRSGDGRERDVPPPSALASGDCPWKHRLKGDLDAIALRACALDQAQRYASVQELAADLDAWLRLRPVSAMRGGRGYRAWRFLQRHRLAVGLAGFAALALVGGLAAALWQAHLTREQRDAALRESAKSRAMLDFMVGLFEQADPAETKGRELTVRELLATGGERMRERFKDQPEVRAELLGAMAAADRGLGYYQEALPLAEEAVALARETGTPDLLHAQELNRARILHHLGRYHEALVILDPLQARLEGDAPDTLPLRAGVAHARALALQATNRLDEAEQAYRHAYALRLSAFGGSDRASQETALRLVSLHVLRMRLAEAEALARSTLTAVRASTGERDPHRAEAIDALAMVLANTGPLQEAEALRREELAIREQVYGDAHPSTVGARNNLAGVLYAQGRYDEASEIYREVLAARRTQYGSSHPAVATAANNLATSELEAGRAAAGREPAEEALAIRLAAYGPNHHTTATSLHTLGAIELELGDPAALGHLQRSVASWEAAMGAGNARVAVPLRDLARAQLLFGRADPGCAVAERAWGMAQGQESARMAYIDAIRGACLLATGHPGAEAAMRGKVDALRGLVGDGDPRVRRVTALVAAARGASRP
jgi:tetratricopeptide (TPR) repeat protein